MIPAGYMLKKVERNPGWLKNSNVKDIYSLSSCISSDFADYIEFWEHNGYWLFNSPEIIYSLVEQHDIDITNTQLFYYEVYEYQSYEDEPIWESFSPCPSFLTAVKVPKSKILEGFDVVSVTNENLAECSYLSCNHLAEELKVNQHCLFDSFDEAKEAIENVAFKGCEPGPCRIYAVYSLVNEAS